MEYTVPASSVNARSAARRWLVAASVSLGLFAVALDTTVNVALPTIARSFQVDPAALQWIIIAFVTTNTSLSLGIGSAADRFGLVRFFRFGLLVYAAAMVLITIAPDLKTLVALRVLQGVGVAALMAVGPALVSLAFAAHQRGRALGITTGLQATGAVASGFGGGLLVDAFGWQAVFVGRLPFILAALLLAAVVLREDVLPLGEEAPVRAHRFDLAGGVALCAAVGSLLVGLNLARGVAGLPRALALVLLLGAAAAFAILVVVERRAPSPLLDMALFRKRGFSAAFLAVLLNMLGIFTIWFIFPFYVATVIDPRASVLGVLIGVQGLSTALSAPIGGWLADRLRPPPVMAAAGLAVAAALAWIASLDADTTVVGAALPLVLSGMGQGILRASASTLMFNSVPRERFATTSGALNLGASMGLVLSVALFSTVFEARDDAHTAQLLAEGASNAAALVAAHVLAFRDTFAVAALVALAGAATSLLAWRHRPPADTAEVGRS